MWTLRNLGIAAVAWLVMAAAGPARADGLSKFEQLIKAQLPPGALAYANAKALGDNGFELDDVTITPPPDAAGAAKAEPVKIHSITVDDIDFDSIAKQAPPNFVRGHIDGIDIGKNPGAGVDLGGLGVDRVAADVQLDYRLDPAKKSLTLTTFMLNLNGLARLDLSGALDGVTLDDVNQPGKAMNDASLRSASLVYDDHSLLSKLVPMAAKLQGADSAALIAMAKGFVDGLRAGQGAPTQKVADAVDSYLDDYAAPKGPLKVTLSPPDKVSAATLSGAKGADDVIKGLGIGVEYAGTRPQKADAGPTPGAAPASVGGKADCTIGARLFVWHDDGWVAATVRDPAKSGDNCVVRLDAGDPGDKTNIAPDKVIVWTIDGPGKPINACTAGTKVVVESEGTWYPAAITDRPAADGQCTIKYEDSKEKPEVVPLKRVRTLL